VRKFLADVISKFIQVPYPAKAKALMYRVDAQVKIATRTLDVGGDLQAERIDGREFDLVPDALQKGDLHFGVGAQFDGMKIQKVGFDRKRG
jgi:hypothetical protein